MGASGYQRAHEEFSEKAYVERFNRAVAEVVKGGAPN
jgi:hypothetical protein